MRRIAIASVLILSTGLAGCDYLPDFLPAFFEKSEAIAYEKGKFKGPIAMRP